MIASKKVVFQKSFGSVMPTLLVGAASCMPVHSIYAEYAEPDPSTGWYLVKSITDGSASTNMWYWSEGSRNNDTRGDLESSGLIADKDYFLVGGKKFGTLSDPGYVFPGRSLTIGSDSELGYLIINGDSQTVTNLICKRGSVTLPPASVVNFGMLRMHEDGEMVFKYDSNAHTIGVVRVAGTVSIPEDEANVRIKFDPLPVAKDEYPCEFPVLIVPDTQSLDAKRFVLSDEENVNVYERPVFSVREDPENKTKTLVAMFPGRGKLVVADSREYVKDFSALTSAFDTESSWSNNHGPHEFAIYEFGNEDGMANAIRTPYMREMDYVFPGLVLRTVGTAASFVLADSTKTDINLELTCFLKLYVVKGQTPMLDGTIRMDADVTSTAWNGSSLTVASTLSGSGNWKVVGRSGTSVPHSLISFTADNSGWKGRLSLTQTENSDDIPGTGNVCHQKLVLAAPTGLGGRLDEFNYKALSLANFSEVIVTNSLELAKDLNRGIYVTNTAIIRVEEACDFVCNWPIAFDGPLLKTKPGTLSLGGDARFYNSAGEQIDSPNPNVDCSLIVKEGAVKALRHDCVNGVTVVLWSNAFLALDFNPDSADVKRYGFYNVKTEKPFNGGDGEINIRIDNPDSAVLIASKKYKLGFLTVKTSAADALAMDSRIKFTKPSAFDDLRVRLIREDDADTGLTTYSAYYDFVGFRFIVK